MNLRDTAQEMRAEARRLKEEASRLERAAKVLDPKPVQRAAKAREALAKKRASNGGNGRRSGHTIDLGTGARTTRTDPDAEEVRRSLVHTTG